MRKSFWITLILLSSILAVLIGCENESDSVEGDNDSYTIPVIVKSTNSEYWETVKVGAEDAADEFGAEVNYQGPASETDVDKQVTTVENAVTSDSDAIVLAASDPESLVPPVKMADEADIPVVLIDSGVNEDLGKSFVATDNEKAAAKAAKEMAESIDEEGKIAIVNFVAGASTAIDRENGFKEEIEKYPDVEIVNTFYSDADKSEALNITENILTSTPDIKGIFGANEPSAAGVARAVQSAGKEDDITVIGFDSSDEEIELIEEGVMDGIVVQDPYEIGYKGVEQAVKAIEGEEVEKNVDTGSIYVNEDNLEDEEIRELLYPLEEKDD